MVQRVYGVICRFRRFHNFIGGPDMFSIKRQKPLGGTYQLIFLSFVFYVDVDHQKEYKLFSL